MVSSFFTEEDPGLRLSAAAPQGMASLFPRAGFASRLVLHPRGPAPFNGGGRCVRFVCSSWSGTCPFQVGKRVFAEERSQPESKFLLKHKKPHLAKFSRHIYGFLRGLWLGLLSVHSTSSCPAWPGRLVVPAALVALCPSTGHTGQSSGTSGLNDL